MIRLLDDYEVLSSIIVKVQVSLLLSNGSGDQLTLRILISPCRPIQVVSTLMYKVQGFLALSSILARALQKTHLYGSESKSMYQHGPKIALSAGTSRRCESLGKTEQKINRRRGSFKKLTNIKFFIVGVLVFTLILQQFVHER